VAEGPEQIDEVQMQTGSPQHPPPLHAPWAAIQGWQEPLTHCVPAPQLPQLSVPPQPSAVGAQAPLGQVVSGVHVATHWPAWHVPAAPPTVVQVVPFGSGVT